VSRRKTNSLHPRFPLLVCNAVSENPRLRKNANIFSGVATSNGYPPTQSTRSYQRDIPRRGAFTAKGLDSVSRPTAALIQKKLPTDSTIPAFSGAGDLQYSRLIALQRSLTRP